MKLLLLDLDGTVREPKSESRFINDPADQQLIDGAFPAMEAYKHAGYTLFGVTNQGGVKAGHKRLIDTIAEQRITMGLCDGLIELVFFCPDDGQTCWCVGPDPADQGKMPQVGDPKSQRTSYRKPGGGMLRFALIAAGINPENAVMVGDREEDEGAAWHAGRVPFLSAEDWRTPETRWGARRPQPVVVMG